ncbi:hypothetical protein HY480_02775 [Candidatus Uhrbacteria bacterium]|nr:hypothetical protein [Candidatus Uhrbacteria bacterium]
MRPRSARTVAALALSTVWIGIAVLALPSVVGAAPPAAPPAGNPFNAAVNEVGTARGEAQVGSASLEEIIGKIIQGVLSLTGVIFFALMVYAGYLWMTAQGEEEKITKAKGILTSATIGFAVTLAAYAIAAFVITKLVVESGAVVQ